MVEDQKENPFSLSIGDLMAALLLLFVLILMGVLLQLQEQVEKQNVIVDQFDNLNEELYEDLLLEFRDDLDKWHATIIDSTLSIRFEEPRMLFANNSAKLKDTFKFILRDFFPRYIGVIRKPKYLKEIDEIRIEGHTSTIGSANVDDNYLSNLRLSQKRAASTMKYLFNNDLIKEQEKKWCRTRFTANGLSWSKKIINSSK